MPGYHRILSPTLTVPSDESHSIPVGLLACQRDPLLRELSTTVVSSEPAKVIHPTGRTKVAQKADSNIYEVILHDTVIFPEGGGQPSDIGTITVVDPETQETIVLEVVEAKRRGGEAIHYVKDAAYLIPGMKVVAALGEQGFQRRLDHMSMHTSQHLLSALFDTISLPTLAWSLTASPTPCYVEVPRAPTAEEIESIQNRANQLVFEGRQVWVEVEEMKTQADPASEPTTANPITEELPPTGDRISGKGLPSDYTGGVHRSVIIDGVDRGPCCGTHLPSISTLQLFILPQTVAMSRSTVRVFFVAGPRLMAYLSSTHSLLTSAAAAIGCSTAQAPARTAQEVDGRKKADKRVQVLEQELAGRIGKELREEILASPEDVKVVKIHRHRVEDSNAPLELLNGICGVLAQEPPIGRDYLVVLSSTPISQTPTSTTVVVAQGTDPTIVKSFGDTMRASGIKGGGKGPRYSGKFIGAWKDSMQGATVREALKS